MSRPLQFSLGTMFLGVLSGLAVLGWAIDHLYMEVQYRRERKRLDDAIVTCTALSAKNQTLQDGLPHAGAYRDVFPEILGLEEAMERAKAAEDETSYVAASSDGATCIASISKGPTDHPLVMATLSEAMKVPYRDYKRDQYSISHAATDAMSRSGAKGIPYVIGLLYEESPEVRLCAAECLIQMCDFGQPSRLTSSESARLVRPVNDAIESELDSSVKGRLRELEGKLQAAMQK
jgi:hypothetical protein